MPLGDEDDHDGPGAVAREGHAGGQRAEGAQEVVFQKTTFEMTAAAT